jgi:hypothetical protein
MRRLACLWFGHRNVITLDLLTLEPVFTCLRCFDSAGRTPNADSRPLSATGSANAGDSLSGGPR